MAIFKTYEQLTISAGSSEYVINQYPATDGVKYFNVLRKMLAPMFIAMYSGQETSFAETFTKISDNLDSLDPEIVKDMVCLATGLTPKSFDLEFSGNYIVLFTLLKQILIFNYKDVFIELGLGEMLGI